MPNQQLIDYIKQAQAAGRGQEEIRAVLLAAGWGEEEINEALNFIASSVPVTISKLPLSKFTIIIASVIILFSASGGLAYYFFIYKAPQQEQIFQDQKASIQATSTMEDIVETKTGVDCGLSSSFMAQKTSNETDYEKDPTMVCLGQNLLNGCRKSYAILETYDMGKMRYEISGEQEQNCVVKIEYGNADQISDEWQKINANTFFECPIKIDEILASLGNKDPKDYAGSIANAVYIYIGFQSLSSDSKCKTGIIDNSAAQKLDQYGIMITTVSGENNMFIDYNGRGKKITFTFAVINTGIKDDKYQLDIASLNGWELSVDGWENEKTYTIEVKSRQSYFLQVWVLVPAGVKKGDKEEIYLKAKSMTNELIQQTGKMILEVQ